MQVHAEFFTKDGTFDIEVEGTAYDEKVQLVSYADAVQILRSHGVPWKVCESLLDEAKSLK